MSPLVYKLLQEPCAGATEFSPHGAHTRRSWHALEQQSCQRANYVVFQSVAALPSPATRTDTDSRGSNRIKMVRLCAPFRCTSGPGGAISHSGPGWAALVARGHPSTMQGRGIRPALIPRHTRIPAYKQAYKEAHKETYKQTYK